MEQPGPSRILIVEDDAEMALLIRRLLERKVGAESETAEDCASAREMLASGTYDVITLDYQLPGCDGLELLREIQAMENPPPVVMVTGHGNEQTAVESFKLGASGYVVKDERLKVLLPDAVKHALLGAALRLSEEALLESEVKYRSLIEGLGETVYRMNLPGGEYEYFGPSAKDIFGYTAEEFIDKPMLIRDIIHPDFTEYFNEKWSNLLEGRVSNTYEYKIVDPNGEERWIAQSNRGVFDDDGRIIAIEGICRDVTERKRAEGVLGRYRSMVESAHDAIFFKDLQSRYLMVNGKTLEAFGASLEDVIGKNDFEIMPDEEEARRNVKDDQSVFDTGKSEELVKHMTSKTGEDFWFHAVKVPAFDDRGEIIGLVGVARDITDQKRMEDRLRRSEEYFRALIENAQEVYLVLNRDGTIRYVSPSVENLYGYKPEELIGKSGFEHVDPDQLEELAGIFAREIDNPDYVIRIEYRYQHGDGSWHEHEATCQNLIDDPAVEGVVLVSRDITERKRSEEALRYSEQRYRHLAENMTDVVWTLDMDMKWTYLSPSVERQTGFPMDEAMELTLAETLTPDSLELAMRTLAEALEDEAEGRGGPERLWTLEVYQYCKDGSTLPTELRTKFLRDAEGRISGIIGVARDITERKRAGRLVEVQRDLAVELSGTSSLHEALKETMDAILDATVFDCGGVYLVDEETGALDPAYHTRGFSEGFVKAVSHYEADSPSARLVRQGKALFMNYEDIPIPLDDVRRKEGLGAFGIMPVTDEGRVIGCVNVASHTTGEMPEESRAMVEVLTGQIGRAIKRARLITALAESEERYRLLYDYAGESIYRYSRNLLLTGVNRTGCETIGYDEDELVGKHVLELNILHPDDIEKAARGIDRVLSGEDMVREQFRFVKKDGSVTVADVVGGALYKDGDVVEVVNIAHNITERVKTENELRKANEELKGYAHTVSHDLKGPLSAISLAADILHDSIEGLKSGSRESAAEAEQVVAALERNAHKATRRVTDLLALAESGQLPREASDVDVKEIVMGVLEEMSGEIEEKRVQIDVGPDLGSIEANPTQIFQLFSNLISNAIIHNGSEAPEVRISRLGRDETGCHRFLVRDNGSGILEAETETIFMPFFKGTESGGTGIGLVTVEKIISVYNGEIKAYNDSGACFEFTLRDFHQPSTP